MGILIFLTRMSFELFGIDNGHFDFFWTRMSFELFEMDKEHFGFFGQG